MSFWQRLYETSQNCLGKEDIIPLYHTEIKVQYEFSIDRNSNYIPNSLVEEEKRIIVPCTEESVNRVSTILCPHGLFDSIRYLTRTLDDEAPFNAYISQLQAWCESDFSSDNLKCLFNYLRKGVLIEDMLRDNPQMKYDQKTNVCIRIVDSASDTDVLPWLDGEFFQSWINYYSSLQLGETGLCYISGKKTLLAGKCSKVIGNAKLISSQEGPFIRFTGDIFRNSQDAMGIGSEVSNNVHNMLKWLIKNRKIPISKDVFYIAFTPEGKGIPPFSEDVDDDDFTGDSIDEDTGEIMYVNLRKFLCGYASNLTLKDNVVVCGFEMATPGRLSLIYYNETNGEDLVNRLNYWYTTCYTSYVNKENDIKYYTPSPINIVKYAFGLTKGESDNKQLYSIVQRIIPCILEQKPIPVDIVKSLVRRVSSPFSMEKYEWQKTIQIASAVVFKFLNDRKDFQTMTPDANCTDRSYLFGRLLAYAQKIEEKALYEANIKRDTAAERFMLHFTKKPLSAYRTIYEALLPYFKRIDNQSLVHKWRSEMDEIVSLISVDKNANNPLSEYYILGYSAQMQQFNIEKAKAIKMSQEMSKKQNNV